jgi:hypothetical protein
MPRKRKMSGEELEDWLEVNDPKVQAHIRASTRDYLAGRVYPAEKVLAEFMNERKKGRHERKNR